ncbi:MAG: hypothetical protein KC657_21380 [Myxococcales bacterium]|nr:hypothetical protein [Myxococcales bacterium]
MQAGSTWNGVRYRAGGKRHVESYFIKLNDPQGMRALWLKATILARPGAEPVAEAWAVSFDRERGHVGVKEVQPFARARFSSHAMDLAVRDVTFDEGRLRGAVASAGHAITFDLHFDSLQAPLAPLPAALYRGPFPSSKLVSPHPHARFTGSYEVDGVRTAVDGWLGMQGHNWGKGHAFHYGWGHCNQWDDGEDVVFEGVTARVKVGPALTPPTTVIAVVVRGVRYLLNTPRALLGARGDVDTRRWAFRGEGRGARVEGELSADVEDFAGLLYENPVGPPTYCLNSKIARGRLRVEIDGRPPIELTTRSAALEIGTREGPCGVTMVA